VRGEVVFGGGAAEQRRGLLSKILGVFPRALAPPPKPPPPKVLPKALEGKGKALPPKVLPKALKGKGKGEGKRRLKAPCSRDDNRTAARHAALAPRHFLSRIRR